MSDGSRPFASCPSGNDLFRQNPLLTLLGMVTRLKQLGPRHARYRTGNIIWINEAPYSSLIVVLVLVLLFIALLRRHLAEGNFPRVELHDDHLAVNRGHRRRSVASEVIASVDVERRRLR